MGNWFVKKKEKCRAPNLTKLRDWIPLDKLLWKPLSSNPAAIYYLENHQDELDWHYLCLNPAAIHLLEANPSKIKYVWLSKNPEAIHLLKANLNKVNWSNLSENPGAISLLEANPEKINWNYLSLNPAAIHLLEANLEKIDWNRLSRNPGAINLLKANQDKINWKMMTRNPAAINLLDVNIISKSIYIYIIWTYLKLNRSMSYLLTNAYLNRMNCSYLSANPAAIELLKEHPEKIDWWAFSENPAIFTYDYDKIKEIKSAINKEILEESIKRIYKPDKFINQDSPTMEKEIQDYIEIYELTE